MEDAFTIMERLAKSNPFLAPGINAANARALEEQIQTKEKQTLNLGIDQQLAQTEYVRPELPKFSDGRPDMNWDISPNFPRLKTDIVLAVWQDQYHIKAQMNIPFIGMKYFMDFGGLEKPALDRLFLSRTSGQDYAFCNFVDEMFIDAARQEEACAREEKRFHNDPRFRFQASVISKSQYDVSDILTTAFARLYYNDYSQPDRILILDGLVDYTFKLTPHRGTSTNFNSPTFMGQLV